jgi:hypothetical protein
MNRRMVLLVLVSVALGVFVLGAAAQTGDGPPPEDEPPQRVGSPGDRPAQVDLFGRGEYPGGHLKYTYKVSREGVDAYSITTTEIIPEENGMYRIESSSTDVVPAGAVSISFFGIGLRGLGFRVPTSTGGTVDLSPLSALEEETLEPNREYVLPDGGFLVARDAATIAGVDVVFATYSHADFSNVSVELAMPTDLTIRNLLPLFPYLELEYTAAETPEDGEEHPRMRSFSRIELIEFVYEP